MSNSESTYWTAFYTKPRNEKKVAERLKKKGFEVYCPTRTVLKQWSDRKKKIKEPVFTSYVFGRINEITRVEITMDPGIVSSVFWLGKPAVIKDSEIEKIKLFLEEYSCSEIDSHNLSSGDNIEVESGPFSGKRGVVNWVKGNHAYLSIASLGIVINAKINQTHLKKVG